MQVKLFTRAGMGAAFIGIAMIMGGCQKDDATMEELSAMSVKDAKGSTTTAQSIMIDFGNTTFRIEGEQVYKFDKIAAAAEFGYNECITNQCRNTAMQAAQENRCRFWNAGQKYWSLDESQSSVTVGEAKADITFAGLSWVKNKQFPTNGKYSFSLQNTASDGTITSRIDGLEYSLNGGAWKSLAHTVSVGDETNSCLLPQKYFASVTHGTFPSSLPSFPSTMGDILAADDVLSNNVGCGTTSIGKSEIVFASAESGSVSYNVTVRGIFKGNDGQASTTFTGTSTVTIDAMNCE